MIILNLILIITGILFFLYPFSSLINIFLNVIRNPLIIIQLLVGIYFIFIPLHIIFIIFFYIFYFMKLIS